VLRSLVLALILLAPALSRADQTGEIDWSRRVVKARGQGAPDLSAPSISVARLGAERAAKADALRNLLETLHGVEVASGEKLGTLLQNDQALKSRVDGLVRGFKVVAPHYFSDGGVALDVEFEIDKLPDDLKSRLKVPGSAGGPEPTLEPGPTPPKPDLGGSIDWARRVLKARGQGTPDLGAASISVARLGAERAAKVDALAGLLTTLKGAKTGTGDVGALLQDDRALAGRVDGALRGFRIVKPHYYSDGGVALDVELDLDQLPADLSKLIQAP
jgi:hypothetical protein